MGREGKLRAEQHIRQGIDSLPRSLHQQHGTIHNRAELSRHRQGSFRHVGQIAVHASQNASQVQVHNRADVEEGQAQPCQPVCQTLMHLPPPVPHCQDQQGLLHHPECMQALSHGCCGLGLGQNVSKLMCELQGSKV